MAKTQEELDLIKGQLTAQYGKVYTIEIPVDEDEDEVRTIFLKKFDRATLSVVQKLASGTDSLKAVETFIKNTYIGGDDINEIMNNLDMIRSLESVVVDLISVKRAIIKKN